MAAISFYAASSHGCGPACTSEDCDVRDQLLAHLSVINSDSDYFGLDGDDEVNVLEEGFRGQLTSGRLASGDDGPAEIFSVNGNRRVAIPRHTHYMNRGDELGHLTVSVRVLRPDCHLSESAAI